MRAAAGAADAEKVRAFVHRQREQPADLLGERAIGFPRQG
jgi:hypothetical protein